MKKSIIRPPSPWNGFSALARLICGLLFLICVFGFSVEAQTTQTFSYTGGAQTWVVPAGVTSVEVIAKGASGGTGNFGPSSGLGGTVSAVLSVTPGETLHIYVGGAGSKPNGGYNGGGNSSVVGGGGGGATDIRIGGTDLADRVIVAGGGGVALSFRAVDTRRIASLLPGEHALGFALQQNMPNPFSNETLIRFQLPEAGEAVFSVHDVQGRLLYEQRGFLDAGSHEVRLDGARLGATGVLSYTLRSGAHSATRRMVVVR